MARANQRGNTTVRSDSRKASFLFGVVSLLISAVMIASMLGPLALMRHVFPPESRLVSGPLHDGWLLVAPPCALLLHFVLAFKSTMNEYLQSKLEFICSMPYVRIQNYFKWSFLDFCSAIYSYGISAYWFVTSDGLTVERGWFSSQKKYDWDEVIQRRISCHFGKFHNKNVSFILIFRDGLEIDITQTQHNDVVEHFIILENATKNAETINSPNDPSACPNVVSTFFSRK